MSASATGAPPIARLVAHMIAVDGLVDDAELAVAHQALARFEIAPEQLRSALNLTASATRSEFVSTLDEVPGEHREAVASLIFEIASADERLDRREAELLDAMREAWGVSVAFLNKPIEWDEEQQLVIEADPSDKLLVSAGPGMGKTSVACSRVAHLVDRENVTDSNIWLVSFTRAAITEVKARISDFAENPDNVFAVKISTIDSQAWKIRYGFSPEQVSDLFGGFETGISRAIEVMQERAEDFRDSFYDIEHVIVDEAQDVTGERARFLLAFIALLQPSCGLTVFHDPAQAIYDYAEDEETPLRFTDGLKEMLGDRLQEHFLKRIYRTEEPALLRLYEDLRLDILGNADTTPDDFKARADLVRQAAVSIGGKQFDQAELAGYDDALVLFRRKIEVAQASAFMARDGLPHRLRMSGLPRHLQPWLALTLSGTNGRSVSREQFAESHARAAAAHTDLVGGDEQAEQRWDQMIRHARGPRGEVDLLKLRSRLASSPPDEFVLPEFGHKGPILGTIHASKGREADHVFLQINEGWGAGGRTDLNLVEESRVLFVGATRARRSLAVQGGYALPFATSTNSGRCYRSIKKYRTGFQVQVGITGDVDPFSVARLVLPVEELIDTPTPFPCIATLEKGVWVYRFTTVKGRSLGSTTTGLGGDMLEIGRENPGRGRKSPDRIENISVLGFGSAVAAPGDDRLATAKGTAASSGFWIVPQVCGLPMAFLQW
ncbi:MULTISPECIES: UvrD-helicase domain-containing protein [unclassified Sphingomonas]|uniref:UvrD-helicase domain-containing protein n=1 Tax=unclassified Sphingomonas TaxID=196159 RepID=UPI00226A3C7A|nr:MULTISPECIES: UvrD-helicase domain-containing protein [unclassified Sphingomonas]